MTLAAPSIWLLILSGVFVLANGKKESVQCPEICHCTHQDGSLHVDCSNRNLATLPDNIRTDLTVLDLSNNHFEAFPDELQSFVDMEELNLSGNHFTAPLPGYFKNLKNMQVLNISNNNFDTWNQYQLGENIKKLDLSRNRIDFLDPLSFTGMNTLSFIDLSENRILELPINIFQETKNLETLILARNFFSEVPRFHTSSLKTLDISMCQIISLKEDSFADKTSLLEIDLSMNEIDDIPDNLNSTTLQVLNLSYNDLTSINENTFSSLRNLAVLDLSGNHFEKVWRPVYFSSNLYLREVRLKGNQWNCNYFSIDLLLTYDFLTRNPPKVSDSRSLICYAPSNVTQLTWREAYVKTWHLDDTTPYFTITAILAGVIIGVVVTSCICRIILIAPKRSRQRSEEVGGPIPNLNRPQISNIPIPDNPVEVRIPLTDDSPPTYAEALLMPRLNASFQSLPDHLGPVEPTNRDDYRRSRSINDLLQTSSQANERNSLRLPRRIMEID